MTFIAIIPARWASTRFPGKPLAMLGGKTVIQRVYERAREAVDNVIVATDDRRILDAVAAFGGRAVMTRSDHRSGTDRCREAFLTAGAGEDVIINIQGDEPFVTRRQITALMRCFDDPATDIATLVKPVPHDAPYDVISNPNSPKVVIGDGDYALYFSRSVIPYLRGVPQEEWTARHRFYTHLGMYAYRFDALQSIADIEPSTLETAESLEQLRWLQSGLRIKVGYTDTATIGIDTPDDLRRAEEWLRDNQPE